MYTDSGVREAVVDRLVKGVEYSVTVTALTSHPGVEGPASETATATPLAFPLHRRQIRRAPGTGVRPADRLA